ncbi:MAG: hypothetical protein WCK02_07310 [Bacteroidota bacterium]
MTYGEGPTIKIGVGVAKDCANGDSRGIYIEASLINDIAKIKETNENYDALLVSIGALILHEATHYGDAIKNDGKTTEGSSDDKGKQNTESANCHRGSDVGNNVVGSEASVGGNKKNRFLYN